LFEQCTQLAASALLLATAALALASCGGSTGESGETQHEVRGVAVSWLEAMAESNIRTACRLMDAQNHRAHSGHPQWSPARNCRETWLHSDNTPLEWKPKAGVISVWGDSSPKVLGARVTDDKAVVWVKGIGQERPIWLHEEHGRWLVDRAEYPI
jgi:hypothetical protein